MYPIQEIRDDGKFLARRLTLNTLNPGKKGLQRPVIGKGLDKFNSLWRMPIILR